MPAVRQRESVTASPRSDAPQVRPTFRRSLGWGYLLPVGTVALLCAVWQGLVMAFRVSPILLPSPVATVSSIVSQPGLFARDTGVTLLEVLLGFVAALVVALPLAVVVVTWKPVRRAIYPIILFLQSVPKIALAPLFLVWLGYGTVPKVLVALLTCFFPIFLDSAAGLEAVPEDYISLFRSYEASGPKLLLKLRVPYALPQIFVGLKVGITFAVIGAVVAEFVSAKAGLGFLIASASNTLSTSLAFGGLLVLTVLSIVLFYAVAALEVMVMPWRRSQRK